MLREATHVGWVAEQAVGIPGTGLALILAVGVAKFTVMGWKVRSRRLVAATVIELEVEDGVRPANMA